MMNSESFYQPVVAGPATAAGANPIHPAGSTGAQYVGNSPAFSPIVHPHSQFQQQQLPPQQHYHHQQQQPQHQQHGGGGLLYNNLIPGHYRYGAKPPVPPPGPLSYQRQQQQQQQQGSLMRGNNPHYQQQQHQHQSRLQHVQHSSSSASPSYQNIAPSNASTAASSSRSLTSPTTTLISERQPTHPNSYNNYPSTSSAAVSVSPPSSGRVLKVSEPEDIEEFDDDDDLLVVKLDDDDDNGNDDDEQYYRPFRHQTTTAPTTSGASSSSKSSGGGGSANEQRQMTTATDAKHIGSKTRTKSNVTNRSSNAKKEDANNNSPGVDLLALLLLDESQLRGHGGREGGEGSISGGGDIHNDIASLIRDASAKSQRARSLTYTLAGEGQQPSNPRGAKTSEKAEVGTTIDNDEEKDKDKLYAAASDAHTEAALCYRRVYRTLFGVLSPTSEALPESLSSSAEVPRRRGRRKWKTTSGGGGEIRNNEWELAKSMLMLSDMHARTAKSLYGMGLKWNMTTLTMDRADGDGGGGGGGGCGVPKTVKDGAVAGTASGHHATSNVVAASVPSKNVTLSSPNDDKEKNSSINEKNVNAVEILPPQHERLRMAVRRALDTANHEEDITNSTFLGGSSSTTVTKQSTQTMTTNNHNGIAKRPNKNKVAMIAAAGRGMQPQNWSSSAGVNDGDNSGGINPVDELMKLEKELRCMDMALEMGSSIANLGGGGGGNTAVSSFRPDGSFCVVPPGSSYASSSSMWTSGIILGGGGGATQQQQQQLRLNSGAKQQGAAGVRSRANRLQNFLGGGGMNINATMMQMPNTSHHDALQTTTTSTSIPPSQQQQPQETQATFPVDNVPLDQSWWGGGQGSLMVSSALLSATAKAATDSPSHQSHLLTQQPSSGSYRNANDGDSLAVARQTSSTTNARQLMQLMDSLNRLGNENAQLMREVEGAKTARAEAKAAKDMMNKFKDEYTQRFSKLKEALNKYNGNPHMNGSDNGNGVVDGDNVVANSSYVKSATMLEIQKRDQIIKQLSNDLKKERDECKRKDSALQKYEAFYREVKARSAEKARQRQQQLQKEKQQLQLQQLQQEHSRCFSATKK